MNQEGRKKMNINLDVGHNILNAPSPKSKKKSQMKRAADVAQRLYREEARAKKD